MINIKQNPKKITLDNFDYFRKELYLFLALSSIAGTIFNTYYSIFLYNNTFDLKIIIIDTLFIGISSWIGYIIGTFWIYRSGYQKAIKLSFIISFISTLLTFLLAENIKEIYIYLAILRGLPSGIYTSVIASYLLKEITKKDRDEYFYFSMSFNLIIGIVMPLFLGLIVTFFGGFKVTFLVASCIYLIGFLMPLGRNVTPSCEISLDGFKKILKLPCFREYALNKIVVSGADQLNAFLIAIVPYLIIKSVLGVGLLSSFIGVVAAITAFISVKFSYKKQIYLGYIGGVGRVIGNLFLIFSWSTFGLAIRSLIGQIISIFTDPITNRLNMENTDILLGEEKDKRTLEINLIDSTLNFLGQTISLVIFLLLLTVVNENLTILKITFFTYAVWKIGNYIWIQSISKRLKMINKQEDSLVIRA